MADLESLGFVPSASQTDPNDFSNLYNSQIPPDKTDDFIKWVGDQRAKGHDPLKDYYDYDVNGFFLSGGGTDERGHGSDEFKKPNHTTFSDQSKYNGVDGYQGGRWQDPANPGERGQFLASPTNMKFNSPSDLQDYFSRVEPDTKLVIPQTTLPGGNPLDYKSPQATSTSLDTVGFVPID